MVSFLHLLSSKREQGFCFEADLKEFAGVEQGACKWFEQKRSLSADCVTYTPGLARSTLAQL